MPLPPLSRDRLRVRGLAAVGVAAALVIGQAGASGGPGADASATPVAASDLHTSFEGDGLPPGGGRLALDSDGQLDVSGVTRPNADEAGLVTEVDSGPDTAYAAKTGVGFTGLQALHYVGQHEAEGAAHSTSVVMDVDVPVGPDTELSYLVFPDFDEDLVDYASTYVAIDLGFSDGTRLSDLDVEDQHGTPLTARAQGDVAIMYPLQWNHRSAAIGQVAAGKTIESVLLTYDGPAGPVEIGGWVDDIRIVGDPDRPDRSRPSDWVNTLRGTHSNGTYSRGNNIPAAAVPNGFNFWTPMTDAGSMSEIYRYHERNNKQNLPEIQAFTASHQPSIWMGDRQTFQVMPSATEGVPDPDRQARALAFDHENEQGSPHLYDVTFENGLRTELAPADHAAMFRFTFPEDGGRHLIFDNIDDRSELTIDEQGGTVTGWSETRVASTGMTRMFVYATFDAPVADSGMLTEGHRASTSYLSFDDDVVTMRIATSLISVDQAERNLDQEIDNDDTMADVVERAQSAWDERLGVVEVEGASDDELTTLYSNLYRLSLYPNSGHENVGTVEEPRYQHAVQSSGSFGPPESTSTETGAEIADGTVFVNNGFWDTFRSAWPAYSLLHPEVAGDLVDGFTQQYRDGGWISPWSSPGYARVMTGTSSDSAFADAYVKNVPGINVQDTYDAALKNATVRPPSGAIGRHGIERSTFLGYVPREIGGSGFAWTLDGFINDAAVADMADVMAEETDRSAAERNRLREEAEYLRVRSQGFVDLYDPAIDFFQGKTSDGEWTTSPQDYDPEVWGNDHDYTEANGWNVAFTAPHDVQGLAEVYGGREGLADKLDTFFSARELSDKPGSYGGPIHEMRETRDFRLGQWSIPNQVSYHHPWLYSYVQQPWKGHEMVRAALDRGWTGSEIGQGYPGDEDNGASSSWWVMSALGLYSLDPASGEYVIGSPLFEKATVHLPGGDLVIEAPGTSDGDIYVQGLTVDGVEHTAASIRHDELADGATLQFTMGSEPSAWGTGADDVPASVTEVGEQPRPFRDVTGPDRGLASASTGDDVSALFDNTSETATTLPGRGAPTVEYQVNGGDQTQVDYYTITSGPDAPENDPSRWVLQGSADGERWTVLDRRSNEEFRWRDQTRPFQLDRPASMQHYRLQLFSGRGEVTMAEVELLTRDAVPESPLQIAVDDVACAPGRRSRSRSPSPTPATPRSPRRSRSLCLRGGRPIRPPPAFPIWVPVHR